LTTEITNPSETQGFDIAKTLLAAPAAVSSFVPGQAGEVLKTVSNVGLQGEKAVEDFASGDTQAGIDDLAAGATTGYQDVSAVIQNQAVAV
jgi:hypothetical protein